jgi:hypothetical protein
MKNAKPVVVVVASAPNGSRVRSVVRWIRALVPTAALVVSMPGPTERLRLEDEAIVVDADALPSGPLSLAVVLAQARDHQVLG